MKKEMYKVYSIDGLKFLKVCSSKQELDCYMKELKEQQNDSHGIDYIKIEKTVVEDIFMGYADDYSQRRIKNDMKELEKFKALLGREV